MVEALRRRFILTAIRMDHALGSAVRRAITRGMGGQADRAARKIERLRFDLATISGFNAKLKSVPAKRSPALRPTTENVSTLKNQRPKL